MPSKAQRLKPHSKPTPSDPTVPKSINWPALSPLVPIQSLHLETLLDHQIVLIRNFFPSTLCKTLVPFLATLPLITTPAKAKAGEAVRVNDRFQVDDPAFAERLWKTAGLETLLQRGHEEEEERGYDWGGELRGLNPRIRIYRYTAGQHFAPHYDDSNKLTLADGTQAKTTWTLLVYLTGPASGCVGGETVFYPEAPGGKGGKKREPIVVDLEVGMALLHKHGRECMLHEGRRVVSGEKWVVRSDVCVRR